jgi:SAM-dependent methyltransferase
MLKDRARQVYRTLRGLGGECKRAHCNVCDTKGVLFTSNQWVRAGICARCGSEARHRILTAAFQYHRDLAYPRTLYRKDVVHLAPERGLQAYIGLATRRYIKGDLFPASGDIAKIDLTAMPQFGDASLDAIIAMDVFEHIPDDAGALRECRRVLRAGGYLIVSVPSPDHFAVTDEDASIVSPEDRTRYYGQHDHVRMYGSDLAERIGRAGYEVTTITAASFDPAVGDKHNLAPEGVLHPLATNHRMILFARKPAGH